MDASFIDWDNVGLGVRYDTEIAKSLGVSVTTVKRRKRERGIKGLVYRPKSKCTVDWDNAGLGLEPDAVIAKKLDVDRKKVCDERNRRKIVPFTGYILTQENIPCRSLQEAMYDAYLHWKNIDHEHEVKVGKYRADFKIGDEYHEVAGLMGYRDLTDIDGSRFDYGRKLQVKLADLQEAGYVVVVLTTKEVERMYKACPLELKFKIDHDCMVCKNHCNDYLMKGLCNKCYMKKWHSDNAENTFSCDVCKKYFESSNPKAKYCSTDCYHESHKESWPSMDELENLLKSMTYAELSCHLGVSYSALTQHVHRCKLTMREL